eukprot:scaffold166_cov106-Skeletonema_dohrnii-CCMP3373.AAC.11
MQLAIKEDILEDRAAVTSEEAADDDDALTRESASSNDYARRERVRIRHTQCVIQNQVAPVFCTCFKMSTLNTMQGQRESKPKTADCLSLSPC